MTERTKKILAILAFLASVVGIGTALYVLFFAPAQEPPAPTVGEEAFGEGGLPTAGLGDFVAIESDNGGQGTVLPPADEIARGGLTKTTILTAAPVTSIGGSDGGTDVNYYDPADGRFYATDADGNVHALSPEKFPAVSSVAWNGEGNKAVLEFPDGSNVVYDFENERQVTLPKHWEEFAFSPVSDRIMAKSLSIDPGNRALVVSNADGSNARAVQALGENADKVQVNPSPNRQVIAFSDTGEAQAGFGRSMILPLGENQENFKGLIVEGLNFQPLWNPRGDVLVYSVAGETSGYKPLLWAVDGSPNQLGNNRRSLGVYTWADKCAFADQTVLYCAAPPDLPENAGLQPVLAASLPDVLYRIELDIGRATVAARPATDTTMRNLRVASDGSVLYFQNALTGRLEAIRLK
ncbi:hypothetical protein HY734_03575 [Candidatus Uhrbacteria bacterium]|nr:hypothetical protein [Candidatus Uhrbacteria bacterium]